MRQSKFTEKQITSILAEHVWKGKNRVERFSDQRCGGGRVISQAWDKPDDTL